MEALREHYSIKSSDLRKVLDIAPATLSDLFKKVNASFTEDNAKSRGQAKNVMSFDVRNILNLRGYNFPKSKIIAMIMCKGGVGKTTSTVFLAMRLAAYGARVLMVDTDMQGNATSAFNLNKSGFEIDKNTPILIDVLEGNCSIQDAVIKITPNLSLIPSTPLNANLERKISDTITNYSIFWKEHLKGLEEEYDYILFDCAPAKNITNSATICAADLVIMPCSPDLFSKLGLEQTIEYVEKLESDFSLKIDKKVLLTKIDRREYTSNKYLNEIIDQYREKMFTNMIRISADCKNAITKNEDLFSYKKSSAKDDYDDLTKEIMGLENLTDKKLRAEAIA